MGDRNIVDMITQYLDRALQQTNLDPARSQVPVHAKVPPDGMSGGTVGRVGQEEGGGQAFQTWNSDNWPAGQPVLAVTVTRK